MATKNIPEINSLLRNTGASFVKRVNEMNNLWQELGKSINAETQKRVREEKRMSERVKIYIHKTGQTTTAKWRTEHIKETYSDISILDEISDLEEFYMFSNVSVFFENRIVKTEFYCGAGKLIERFPMGIDFWNKTNKESEETTMKHNVTITTKEEKTVDEYWELQATKSDAKEIKGGWFDEILDRKESDNEPTIEEIGQFLFDSQADFVTVSHNYRFAKESEEQ